MNMWGDSLEMVTRGSKDINSRIRHLKTQGAPSWCSIVGTAYENMERVVQHLEAALRIKNRTSVDKDIEEIVKKCETMSVEEACEGKKAPVKKAKKAKKKPVLPSPPAVRDARRMDLEKPWYVEFLDARIFFNTRDGARYYANILRKAATITPKTQDERTSGLGWSVETLILTEGGTKLHGKAYFKKRDDARAYAKLVRSYVK